MNKVIKFSLFIFLGIIFVNAPKAIASMPAPSPICHIEGDIKGVEFKDAYIEACVADNSCPTDTATNHPARYFLTVKVSNFNYVGGNQSFTKCSDTFSIGKDASVIVNKANVKSGDIFKIGQKISGDTIFSNGLTLNTYTLKNADTTDQKATTTKTTTPTDTTKSKGGFWAFISRLFSFLF